MPASAELLVLEDRLAILSRPTGHCLGHRDNEPKI